MPKVNKSTASGSRTGESWAFVRVSTREQQQEGFSLEVQEESIRAAAKRDGTETHRVFRVAETASTAQARIAFKAMVQEAAKAARKGTLSTIYFDRVDRALRNFEDLATTEKLHREFGIRVRIVTPEIDTSTPHGSFLIGVMASIAKYETEARKETIRSSQRKRVEHGLFPGHAVHGFENYSEGKRRLIRLHPERSANVRLIFELFETGKFTVRSLIAELWKRGVRYTEASPRYSHSKLHRILTDRSYLGEVSYQGAWHPGTHPALVDKRTFDRVQRLLGNRVYLHHETTYGHKLITCGYCGRCIVGEPKERQLADGTTREYVYYCCSNYRTEGHPGIRLTEAQLNEQVASLFESLRVGDEELIGWFRETLRDLASDREADQRHQRRRLEAQLTRLDEKKAGLVRLHLDGRIDESQFLQLQDELREDERTALQRLEELCHRGSEDAELAVATFELSQRLTQRWDAADVASRRQILQILASNWVLEGRTLLPDLRKPFDLLSSGLIAAGVEDGSGGLMRSGAEGLPDEGAGFRS